MRKNLARILSCLGTAVIISSCAGGKISEPNSETRETEMPSSENLENGTSSEELGYIDYEPPNDYPHEKDNDSNCSEYQIIIPVMKGVNYRLQNEETLDVMKDIVYLVPIMESRKGRTPPEMTDLEKATLVYNPADDEDGNRDRRISYEAAVRTRERITDEIFSNVILPEENESKEESVPVQPSTPKIEDDVM